MSTKVNYDALAADLTNPSTPSPEGVGPALTGEAAAAEGRAFLLREYGSEAAIEAAMRPGRPALDPRGSGERRVKEGPSPVIKGRVPADYLAAIKQLESQTGKSQSELVREGMTLLLKKHHLIGS